MDIQEVIRNKNFQIGGVGVGCFLAGAASGYFYAKHVAAGEDYILIEEAEELGFEGAQSS